MPAFDYWEIGPQSNRIIPTADKATHAINVVDYAHHEIHSGSAYIVIHSMLRADTEVSEVRIQTPDTTKWAHALIGVQSALASTVAFHESTSMTHTAANVMTPLNRDRNSTSTSAMLICHTPTGADTSAPTFTEYIGASASGGRIAVGGGSSSRAEYILKQNEDYLIRVTSRADGNAITILVDWYEHTNR